MKKRLWMNQDGMTLVEVLTAFFILILASNAVLFCVSGYSRVIRKSRELSAAGIRVERLAGDTEHGTAAEIHLEIGGEKFVEPGYYAEETVSDGDGSVFGFWTDPAVIGERFADEE